MNLIMKSTMRLEQSLTKNILIDNDMGEFYECNETAVFLIQKLFHPTDKEKLVRALLDTYDLTKQDACIQVNHCLALLTELRVLNEST